MAAVAHPLRRLLRLLALPFLFLLSAGRWKPLFSFISLKEHFLHLLFLYHHLRSTLVFLDDPCATIHLWTPSPHRRRRPKPPLLLLHGYGAATKWQWEHQVGPLAGSFDLYVPDLVFFGDSTSKGAKEFGVAFQARCMAAAMRRLGVERYMVAGISYGGFVAYRMAAEEAAEAVERVVVMTAGVCAGEEERRWLAEREGRDVSEILLPRKAEDLMLLLRRTMQQPPAWIPAWVLEDYIQVSRSLEFGSK